jgi:hypothetical protein
MDQHAFIARITPLLEPDLRVRALFLSGSFGRGTDDAFSDVDLVALVDPSEHQSFAGAWRGTLEQIAPVVHFFQVPFAPVWSSITDRWLRCDLMLVAPTGFNRAQDQLKPLIDRDGIYPALPPVTPPHRLDPARLAGLIAEFIRVLGLLPVADGRGEYELAAVGSGLLRGMLTDLLVMETGRERGGMLHLSRVLDPDRMDVLLGLPVAQPRRDSAIAAQLALARVFVPRAKALAAAHGVAWPEAFEAATRANLARALPSPHRADW